MSSMISPDCVSDDALSVVVCRLLMHGLAKAEAARHRGGLELSAFSGRMGGHVAGGLVSMSANDPKRTFSRCPNPRPKTRSRIFV